MNNPRSRQSLPAVRTRRSRTTPSSPLRRYWLKNQDQQRRVRMRYQLAPLYCRPWTLNGISPRLIESHYENNYGAALNRLNAISDEIERFDFGNTSDQSLVR